jgi:thymidylate synthase (FAD)
MPRYVTAGVLDVIGLEDPEQVLKKIEHCGRVAYASWDKEGQGTAEKFVQMIIKLGHESVLEHASVTAIIECDRSTAQQLTRHRLASFTMQSQRYCNYSADKFDKEVRFVLPEFKETGDGDKNLEAYATWQLHMNISEQHYFDLLKLGCSPEDARSVLPNSTACVLAMTANMREWRHIFKVRTEICAQHNVRRVMSELMAKMSEKVPCLFADIGVAAPH